MHNITKSYVDQSYENTLNNKNILFYAKFLNITIRTSIKQETKNRTIADGATTFIL